jgi:regulator of sirC expression with transglutaminase-like and TPR domain
MNLTPDSPSPTPLSSGQREALFRLLDDEDAAVSEVAKQRLISEGHGLIPWLRPHTLSNNHLLRRRAREILLHFEALDADERMRSFCRRAGEDLDLEEGCLRLAQTRFPELNIEAYRALLDDWSTRVAEWLPDDRNAAESVLSAMHTVLFQQLGLRGNETNYYEPENSYLSCVIDRRTGNPITLCTIVLLVGRRLGLPLVGIGLPAHFLCRYQSTTSQIYLDAFHGGRLLNRTDCVAFVNKLGRPFEDSFLQPVSPRRMLQRMCINLEHAYENLEMRNDLLRIRTYHSLLNVG